MTTDTTGRVSGTLRKQIERLADNMWRVHPRDLDRDGYVHVDHGGKYDNPRAAWYADQIEALVLAAIQPDPEPVATRSCTELVAQLSAALEDAINAPKGVVPKTAEPFYDGFQGRVRMPHPDIGNPITPDPEQQPVTCLDGSINVGEEFIWEPNEPHARSHVIVTEIKSGGPGDETWIRSSELPRLAGGSWNEESRFREACIRATPSSAGMVSVEAAAVDNVLRRGRNITASMRIARDAIGNDADLGHLEAIALKYVRWQDLAFLDAALRALAGERG